MLLRDLGQELASFLSAGYPYLVLRSVEEERVLGLMSSVARKQGRPLVPVSMTMARKGDPDAGIEDCLERISQERDPAIFAAIDLDAWIDDPVVIRKLRDMRVGLEERKQTVVFVSAQFRVPYALSADIQLIDVPLPVPDALCRLLESEAQQVGFELGPSVAELAVRAVQGLPASAARRAFRRAILDPEGLAQGHVGGLVEEKRRLLERADLLELIDTPPGLGEVGGLDALKTWLGEREAAFGDEAKAFGLPTPKGLLLVGVQGCGKSLVAKAVAQAWSLPLARLDFSALHAASETPEERLRAALRLGEALTPAVLWLDEIDKAFQSVRGDGSGSASLQRMFATFITWLQEKTVPTFVVATANSVDHLPPELLRKGRFDEIFFVDLPSESERAEILAIHLERHGRDPGSFDLESLSARTAHYSGAELEQLVIAGLYRAFRQNRELATDDLATIVKSTVPLYRTFEDEIKGLREWAWTRARRASSDDRVKELFAPG